MCSNDICSISLVRRGTHASSSGNDGIYAAFSRTLFHNYVKDNIVDFRGKEWCRYLQRDR